MAGITLTDQRDEGVIRTATLLAVAESDGSFTSATLRSLGVHIDGTIIAIATDPGTTAPTDLYDLALTDDLGLDRLAGLLANRSTSSSETRRVNAHVSPLETLTLSLSGNLVADAEVTIVIYYATLPFDAPPWNFDGDRQLRVSDEATQASLDELTAALTGATGNTAVASVAASASNVTLLDADATRREVVIFNASDAFLYVKYGATATTSDYTARIDPWTPWIDDVYRGQIDGIWASATGAALVTEVLP